MTEPIGLKKKNNNNKKMISDKRSVPDLKKLQGLLVEASKVRLRIKEDCVSVGLCDVVWRWLVHLILSVSTDYQYS